MRKRTEPCFKKIDIIDSKWTRGRACMRMPGRIIVTATNFRTISYLNLEDYSYTFHYRHPNVGTVPNIIAEEYFQCKYLKSRGEGKFEMLPDMESRHLREARTRVTYEYDLYVLKKLKEDWDDERFKKYLEFYEASQKIDYQRTSLLYSRFPPVLSTHCTDSTLVVRFFETVCSHAIACESMYMGSTPYLKLFLEHTLKIGLDPWALLRKFQRQRSSPVVEFCPVEWCLVQGKLEHLKLLLRYGCPFHVSNYSARMFNKKIDGRFWNRNRSPPIAMPGAGPSSPLVPYRQSAAYLAHFTVAVYLTANTAVICGGFQRFTDSIRLFMRSVPECYVSYEDMLAIVTQLAPSFATTIGMSCDWYRSAFPDETGGHGRRTRSLMHLSRCVVRQSCELPHGIAKLPLPDYLKSYLNLEW